MGKALRDTQKIVNDVKAEAFKGLNSSMYHSHNYGTSGKEKYNYRGKEDKAQIKINALTTKWVKNVDYEHDISKFL